jgi:hypothetical protein
LALLPPAFLAGVIGFGHPAWPKFLPAEQRLDFARDFSGAYSWEHVPAEAAASGWVAITAGQPDPWARPVLPPGAERLPGGFRLPQVEAPVVLPQFYFPAWQAWDALGPLPLRPTLEGFLELAPDRPASNVEVRIVPTLWEQIGWMISLLTAAGLLLLQLPLRGLRVAAPLEAHLREGSDRVPAAPLEQRR